MRLTIVQYAGDYRQTFESFAAGGMETYQAQRYSVGFVGSLTKRIEQVAVVCALTDKPYDVELANGVRSVGGGLRPGFAARALVDIVASTRPDRLSITTPIRALLDWAIDQRVRTIAPIADSFGTSTLRQRLRNLRLLRKFNNQGIEWIGNHGLNACISLLDIGVQPHKIVPWDWPPSFSPHDRTARTRKAGPLTVAYVGGVSEAKGVGDLLRALSLLRARGVDTRATIYGSDIGGAMEAFAGTLELGDAAVFAGPISNELVLEAMREADAVVVPSRHVYPEGLPLTIYEALSARTPIVASDHPMFRGAIVDGESALIFKASEPESMALTIEKLGTNTSLYARLSQNSADAWDKLQLPVPWGALLSRWIDDDDAGRSWLADHSIASGRYDARLVERRRAMAG